MNLWLSRFHFPEQFLVIADETMTGSPLPPINTTLFSSVHLYNKRRYVCLFVSMFCMAGQTAGPIETKLDTRTHVHPGSVSVKVNVKVIHVCVRE